MCQVNGRSCGICLVPFNICVYRLISINRIANSNIVFDQPLLEALYLHFSSARLSVSLYFSISTADQAQQQRQQTAALSNLSWFVRDASRLRAAIASQPDTAVHGSGSAVHTFQRFYCSARRRQTAMYRAQSLGPIV